MRSGLVSASSLWTLQELDMRLVPPLGSLLQDKQRDNVADIGVEHLLVSGVCRSADYLM